MNDFTREQIAALADLLEIGLEKQSPYRGVALVGEKWVGVFTGPNPFDPEADPREVDQCWYVPLAYWLRENHLIMPEAFASVRNMWGAGTGGRRKAEFARSMTLALLNAAIVARVPEVCAALGIETETEKETQ